MVEPRSTNVDRRSPWRWLRISLIVLVVTLVALVVITFIVFFARAAIDRITSGGDDRSAVVEPLFGANWVGSFDHNPVSGELHAIVDLRSSAAVPSEHRFLSYDPVNDNVTVHREDFDFPFGAWVGLARDGTVWAFSAGSMSREPFLWRLDTPGEIASVPVVRLADIGCDAVNEGHVDELGVWIDDGILRPKLLMLDGDGTEQVAVDVGFELGRGSACGLEDRALVTPADLERNLQTLAIDGWLQTAAAEPEVIWVDTTQNLEIREASAGVLRQLTGNSPCERVKDRVQWQGQRMDLQPCRGIANLPTSGQVVTDDGLVVALVLRGIGLLRP